jgi:hypothetical protein
LVDLIAKHRKYADAEWALLPEALDGIASVAEKLGPQSLIYRHQRLFSERDFDLFEEKGNYQEEQEKLQQRRNQAINEVFAAGGVGAVLELAGFAESPFRVGWALGLNEEQSADGVIVPDLLESETQALARFAAGFVCARFRLREWPWVDALDTAGWTPSRIGLLLAYLPFTPATWERVGRLLREDQAPYWSTTRVNPYEAVGGLATAIDRLVEYGQPLAAIDCLERLIHEKQPFEPAQAIRVLLAVLQSPAMGNMAAQHGIREILGTLQEQPNGHVEDILRLEWAFLSLLDRHYNAAPKLLERHLADDPNFYCEVIRRVFRSRTAPRETTVITEEQSKIAMHGFKLLQAWRRPPGTTPEGKYDGDALNTWLAAVKAACSESGHLEVALTHVGHVLVYVKSDLDGLWLHHAAAHALNAADAGDMRDGFCSELFNSRGVYSPSGGQEEQTLATGYRMRAEELEAHGYHRVAASLQALAESYERQAERDAAQDEL